MILRKARFLLGFLMLAVLTGCAQPKPQPPAEIVVAAVDGHQLTRRDKLNLSLGLTGGFSLSCAGNIRQHVGSRKALFHFLNHAQKQVAADPFTPVTVFEVPDYYDRPIRIVASYDDLIALERIFSVKTVDEIYSALSAPYDPAKVPDSQHYATIFKNARFMMERQNMRCVSAPVVEEEPEPIPEPAVATEEAAEPASKSNKPSGPRSLTGHR